MLILYLIKVDEMKITNEILSNGSGLEEVD